MQSRYYNPAVGRFLNADGYVSTGQGLLGNNMFAYCNNNPVNYTDKSGKAPIDPSGDFGGWIGESTGKLLLELIGDDTVKVLHEVGNAATYNLELSCGFGLGLYLGGGRKDFLSVEAGIYYDLVHIEYADATWSVSEYSYEGINAAIPLVPVFEESVEQYRAFDSNEWITKSSQPSLNITGGGAYFFGGASFAIGFDIIGFLWILIGYCSTNQEE